ncbi:MAG: helix-turn-helix domain-containing protein [bacterium]|nr:MAG: helix-turn-helix domain-containing protein [bacterium]
MISKEMLNDLEAARLLGLRPQTLRNWRHKQRGPSYIKLGRRVVYKLSDLSEYLTKHRINPEKTD